MAKNKNKKTTFIPSKSVVTDEFMNSIYGGLKGTDEESLYSTTDPLVGGHVHDGVSADGHAQKIDLSKHVTGQLPSSMIAGSFGKPSDPRRSIQFNSADTFGGSAAFSYYSSTDSLQLSKDYKFYYGSIDNTNSFYIENNTADSHANLKFFAANSSDSQFVFTTNHSSTTDIVLRMDGGAQYFFPRGSEARLGIDKGGEKHIWESLKINWVEYYGYVSGSDNKYVRLNAASVQQSYSIQLPKYRPTSDNLILKSVNTTFSNTELTWDTFHSPGTPVNSFQFNSADTFGGSETFYFEPSTRDVVFAKDQKWWFGSSDSSNSFWFEHEMDGSIPVLEFYAKNSVDSEFIFTNGLSGTTDVVVKLKHSLSYVYPTGTGYLGKADSSHYKPWSRLYVKDVRLQNDSATTHTADYINLNASSVEEHYNLEFPKFRPTTVDQYMRVVRYGLFTELTWDSSASFSSISSPIGTIDTFRAFDIQTNSFTGNTVEFSFGSADNVSVGGTVSTKNLRINDAYSFPIVDGTANYVLKTNGGGVLTWVPDTDTTINAGIGLLKAGNTIDVSGTINSVNINTADVDSLSINGSYTFPNVDGSANYILKTDGSGTVFWTADSSSGLENVVEDTTPQLGGDLDAQNNHITSVNNLKFYNSGPIMRSTSFNRILFIDPSTTPHASNSVRIASIGNASDAWDNGHASNISKLESDTGSKFLLASNGFANTSVIQINDNLDTTDSQSNLREGIELRAWETSGGIASVAIKSLSLNSTNGQPQSRSPELRFYNKDGNYIGLRAPGTTDSTSDYSFVLPINDGTADQFLRTDGSGNLSWVDPGGNSAGSNIVITANGTIETSNDILVNTIDSNFAQIDTLNINNKYTFPTVDGSANYILKTNGSGVVTWTVDGGSSSGISNVVEDTTPELGGQLVTGANKISFASGDATSELNFQYTLNSEANHTYISTVKSFNIFLDKNGGDSGQAVRVYNNINPTSGSPNDDNYIWKLHENGTMYMTNNIVIQSTDNIEIGTETITETKIGQWDTAYSWGNHSVVGYISNAGNGLTKSGNTIDLNLNQNLNTADVNSLSINGNYTFPTVDGSANYILKTNGSGTVTWTVDRESQHWQTNSTTDDIYYASGNMGVGISNPSVRFHMSGDGANTSQIRMDQYSGTGVTAYDGPDIACYSARGTKASPAAREPNDYIGAFNMRYYNGSSYLAAGFFGWQVGDSVDAGSSWFNIKTAVPGAGGGNKVRFKIEKSGAITFGNDSDGTRYTFPLTDGTEDYVLKTNGSGDISWSPESTGLLNVVEDTSPELGGHLNLNSKNIQGTGNIQGTIDLIVNNVQINNALRIEDGVEEKTQTISNATGTVAHNCSGGHIFFHSSISGNFTVNLTNLSLSEGYSTVVTLILEQGGSARDVVGLQIATAAQTINWQGGSAPTAGTNSLDVVTFSIYRNGVSSYIVLGQLMNFDN